MPPPQGSAPGHQLAEGSTEFIDSSLVNQVSDAAHPLSVAMPHSPFLTFHGGDATPSVPFTATPAFSGGTATPGGTGTSGVPFKTVPILPGGNATAGVPFTAVPIGLHLIPVAMLPLVHHLLQSPSRVLN